MAFSLENCAYAISHFFAIMQLQQVSLRKTCCVPRPWFVRGDLNLCACTAQRLPPEAYSR